ncbi:haloalkane dehalogenase [Tenacibaculum finnmarkense genomovar finnmarkense]|uniref:Haloalkane dehalogenase n=1 Tax=Tenacibaculum finnmarkense genomovar finnmarkense TaxID=1458503 RepID=A0AAP1REP9_9FLAO|nr:haloalkane dehalogenase [Tenacibaculum finnmarkense]MBE7652641.1 haloalkane dehalogenase [Tenacibaculum finnmarkense genomovar finnmarkense]MBE7660290.1 haloalkane dehalogenase [Tenacibaculum finnmarkense genomovar finnmarkense]MBE7694940.1 haloalkane dehalogenase [Tenacibaculum finnmarkense genomovar finnmarkense]MCD8412236.1 haloalkane dehalogenase [Tenacibaculum finnmarkense genomovar ulcerans]MCD8416959.1 haloalkane dehalogenase [Tenacibaculum finnmarkense genomovar finnmarkense]
MAQDSDDMHSNYYEIYGSKMHVLEYGKEEKGNPVLFLHGNPSSSFLWRNIIPYVEEIGHHIIVPDLIGMGKSDKPAIDYTFIEQYIYVEKLIKQMKLENITLVLHDWGSGLGFNYFANHQDNVKSIVFMEGIIQDIGTYFPKKNIDLFNKLRSLEGHKMITKDNFFLNDILPTWVSRDLTKKELESYKAPFQTVENRSLIWKFITQVPLNGKPELTASIVKNYRKILQNSKLPKLFFYAEPGAFMPESVRNWIIENIPNIQSVNIGEGVHFLQEDNPDLIGEKIKNFILN